MRFRVPSINMIEKISNKIFGQNESLSSRLYQKEKLSFFHSLFIFFHQKRRQEKEPVTLLVLFHASLGSTPHIVMSNNSIVSAYFQNDYI